MRRMYSERQIKKIAGEQSHKLKITLYDSNQEGFELQVRHSDGTNEYIDWGFPQQGEDSIEINDVVAFAIRPYNNNFNVDVNIQNENACLTSRGELSFTNDEIEFTGYTAYILFSDIELKEV